ncbi:adenylosuccinate synthase [Mycoplasmatota bacterium WC44]
MSSVVVVGTQWGDEGKGKITDYLAQEADVVVRYQGGNNAGHTIVFNNQKFALHLLPSGSLSPNKLNIMANGMVINPKALIKEMNGLKERGITDINLKISNRAHIVFPYHEELDGAFEKNAGKGKIGTTKKGIGPTYTDKAFRSGIRMGDLLDPTYFKERLDYALGIKNGVLNMLGLEQLDLEELYNEYMGYAEVLKDSITDTSVILNEELEKGSKVLFEGAQGVMLCTDHGTYPFVTSSSPTAASVPLNTGIAPKYVDNVLGIIKAYTTRVGEGAFPTEFDDEVAHHIRETGNEYGTTTKRPRRIGWLDLVVLNHAKRVSGISGLSVMLLDVLSGVEKLKICTSYNYKGETISVMPSIINHLEDCIPNYIELPGWQEDITGVTSFDELPINAQNYLLKIEDLTGIKVKMFSVGPDRKQTIELEKIL